MILSFPKREFKKYIIFQFESKVPEGGGRRREAQGRPQDRVGEEDTGEAGGEGPVHTARELK